MNAITALLTPGALTASQIVDEAEILKLEHESEGNSDNEACLINLMKELKTICGEHVFAQWPDGTYAFIKLTPGHKGPNPSQISVAYHSAIAKDMVENMLASWPLGDTSL